MTVWDLTRGAADALGQLDLIDDNLVSLIFAPSGLALIAADNAGIVFHWDLAEASWRQLACEVANRNPTREEWAQYIGNPDDPDLPYQATCPELPLPIEPSGVTPAAGMGDSLPATPAVPPEAV